MEEYSQQEFKNILIPLDGSKRSESVLGVGVSLANKYNAVLVLASVFSSKDSDSFFKNRMKEMNPQIAQEIDKMPSGYLMETYHDILKKAISKEGIAVKSILKDEKTTTKSVVNVLLDVVKKEKIDLVIISYKKKSGFKKLKLGSVTEQLMKTLQIPVLCIRK